MRRVLEAVVAVALLADAMALLAIAACVTLAR
jgi:hypothetical protein